ncbi:hypothetical protein KQX54_002448 [Cotesia glomerata]|uniref:Uncharacterized protein n=1 Tax=Cotesia glomerata TaxID=32391 RepID=A0AAV7HS95_COTGL|nr:hypothetical protein KQX54_002448 [Cotesia glomerata]
MNARKISKFNISVIWVLFFIAFAESLMEDYYYRDIIDDGIKLEFFVEEMTPDRQIKIYYHDKLIITQQNTFTASESYVGEKKYLQKIVPDTETLILIPAEINPEEKVIVYHSDGKIHVYQGEEINSTKLVTEFNNSLDSEETISILPTEFNQKKLVLIFFENNKLVLTQKETPEEINPNLSSVEKLQTVTSDKNKLLLHPARLSPEKKINILHKNGKIIVWTGKSDQIPEDSVETLEIVELITEKLIKKPLEMNSDGKVLVNRKERQINVHEIEEINSPDLKLSDSINKPEINQEIAPDLEFDAFFDSGEIAEIFPQEFNLKKLVWIFFCDNQLNVTQLGAPEETRNNIRYKHKNTTVVSSDVNKLLLYPARITPEDRIRILHENRTIYVWQGSDRIPKRHINRPDIFKVIKPTPKPEKPESVLDKLGNSSFDREILMALPELNLKQTFWININGNNNTKVETLNTPHQKISRANGFNNSRIVKSGSNSIVFYPITIDLDFKINVNDNSRVSEEPKINKSKINEPKINELNINKPKIDESKINELKINELNINEPKINESNINKPKINESNIEEPKINETKINEPKINESNIKEPKINETKINELKINESKINESNINEPNIEEPKINETKINELNINEPNIEEPKINESNIEEPEINESIINEQKINESNIESILIQILSQILKAIN